MRSMPGHGGVQGRLGHLCGAHLLLERRLHVARDRIEVEQRQLHLVAGLEDGAVDQPVHLERARDVGHAARIGLVAAVGQAHLGQRHVALAHVPALHLLCAGAQCDRDVVGECVVPIEGTHAEHHHRTVCLGERRHQRADPEPNPCKLKRYPHP
jgi:hypothetical protein